MAPTDSASAAAAKGGSYFPLGGSSLPGDSATATCYCGGVQLSFPVSGDGYVSSFICNCADCRKVTASMFASNFIVSNSHLTHVRGESLLHTFTKSDTIDSGSAMTNHFCSTCGGLMYRRSTGFPGKSVLRIGTVDDFNLHETKLKPKVEQFTKDRVGWCGPAEGVEQQEGNFFDPRKSAKKAQKL